MKLFGPSLQPSNMLIVDGVLIDTIDNHHLCNESPLKQKAGVDATGWGNEGLCFAPSAGLAIANESIGSPVASTLQASARMGTDDILMLEYHPDTSPVLNNQCSPNPNLNANKGSEVGEVVYEIEHVLCQRGTTNLCNGSDTKTLEYCVSYKGYGEEWNQWLSKEEVEQHGEHAVQKLSEFKQGQHEIECVLFERGRKFKKYLVSFKGCSTKWDTWLSQDQIENIDGGFAQFDKYAGECLRKIEVNDQKCRDTGEKEYLLRVQMTGIVWQSWMTEREINACGAAAKSELRAFEERNTSSGPLGQAGRPVSRKRKKKHEDQVHVASVRNTLQCRDYWQPISTRLEGERRDPKLVTVAKGDRIEMEWEVENGYALFKGTVKDIDMANDSFHVVYDDRTAGWIRPRKQTEVWQKVTELQCQDHWQPKSEALQAEKRPPQQVTVAKGDRLDMEWGVDNGHELFKCTVQAVDVASGQFKVVYGDQTSEWVKPETTSNVWRKEL